MRGNRTPDNLGFGQPAIAELAAGLGPLYASGDLRSGAVEPELTVSPEAADRVISRFLDVVETAIRMEGGAGS